MKTGKILSIAAVLIALVGAGIAFAAYMKRCGCICCDDLEDEFFGDEDDIEYYATHLDETDEEACEDGEDVEDAEDAEGIEEPETSEGKKQ